MIEAIEILQKKRNLMEQSMFRLEAANREHANSIAGNNEEILIYNQSIAVIDQAIEALSTQK